MKMLFKQRLFSWFDSYDIYDEAGRTLFTVEGKLSWGHCLHIMDAQGRHIGTVQERVLTFLPQFELTAYGEYLGCLKKEFSFFTPRFVFDCSDWEWRAAGRSGTTPSPAPARACRRHRQGAVQLDGYLCHRRPRPVQRAVRADGGPGHRRGKMWSGLGGNLQ